MFINRKQFQIAVVILAIVLFLCYRSFFPGRVFDAEQWQVNASQRGAKVRLAMADRILVGFQGSDLGFGIHFQLLFDGFLVANRFD